ncbi:MAG: hypothetical protein JSW10_00395 [Pseudomonadota bacterium]|nr:MAG: hypothetical protein JSW10_00395 [Pseudomonadota bacterium]
MSRTLSIAAGLLLLPFAVLAAPPAEIVDNPIVSLDEAIALLGEGVVGQKLADEPLPDPHLLLPSRAGVWTYSIVGGTDKGQVDTIHLRKIEDEHHPHLWQRERPDKHLISLHVQEHVVAITSIIVPEHNLLIEYGPDEMLIPQGMKVGTTVKHRSKVRTVSLNRPSHERAKGFLDLVLTYIGRFRISTPIGEFDTYLMRTDIESKVGPVHQTDTIYNFYAKDVGVVARVARLNVHAVLVYRSDHRNAYLLSEQPRFEDSAGKAVDRSAAERTIAVREAGHAESTP